MPIRELKTVGDVCSACGDDSLTMWAAQGLKPGVRAWALGESVAVASPGLSRRDRLAVYGDVASAASLVRHALGECGPTFRPLGEESLIRTVAERLPGVEFGAAFDWMDATRVAPGAVTGARWLAESDEPEVVALLDTAAPSSYAVPGLAGVRRWAGVREGAEIVAVAADAWSAPSVGLIAGVATAVAHRGRGHAGAVCSLVADTLIAAHGRVALMVDGCNHAAIRLYERLGMRARTIAAAHATRHNP